MKRNVISLDQMLSNIQSASSMTKTASEAPSSEEKSLTAKAEEKKEEKKEEPKAEEKKEEPKAEEKTASASLEKIAQEIAESNHNMMIKEASVYGSVMADAFLARLAQAQQAVEDAPMQKTAEEVYCEELHSFIKTAEDVSMVREFQKYAADAGNVVSDEEAIESILEITKLAQDNMHTAAAHGYEKTAHIIDAMLGQEKVAQVSEVSQLEVMEKIASDMEAEGDTAGVEAMHKYAFEMGFNDSLVKIAASASNNGYANADALISSLG